MESIQKLLDIMAQLRSPAGCPWDREQTYASIVPYTLEEAYEVADAVAANDLDALRDELGDLLFQVVFLSRIAEEQGVFDFASVAEAISDKLVRRHPHVFGDATAASPEAVRHGWERIKAAERAAKAPESSALDGIPVALPALKRAQKLGKRAANVGFDWPDAKGVREKLDEELAEFDAAVAAQEPEAVAEELGDVLFSLANLARHHRIDAEQSLAAAGRKFARRFQGMESAARADGDTLDALDLPALEALWQAQK